MASTYSDRLKLELMETGANANTWGNNTNINLETLDAFTAGYLSKDVAGSANVTLTTANADPDAESSNKVIEFAGTLTGSIYVFIPAVENNYIFFNNTSGAYTLTIAPTGHAANGVAITQGAHTIMYNNANNEIKDLFAASLGNLSLVSGGVFTGNASGASALNASNVSSGTIADARLTANVTLNNASTISAGTLADARLTANVTLNNASTISAGTLSNDRLDTVPTTKGGTGLTSVGSDGQVLTVSGGGLAFQDAAGGGVGNSATTTFNSPGTFTANATTQFITVEVIGAGGGGRGGANGNSGNAGGASSFGSFFTANGGAGGPGGAGGNSTGNVPTSFAGGSAGEGNMGGGMGGGDGRPSRAGGTAGGSAGGSANAGNGGVGGRSNLFNGFSGGGGGAGAVTFGVLGGPQYNPAGQTVTIGSAGNGGNGGSQGNTGGTGQGGRVIVVEYTS